jgi:asparagine synthase (glutamine-hydrolysing)
MGTGYGGCGIAGAVALSPAGVAKLREAPFDAVVDGMRHRGPDGRGTFVEDGVLLGHRRLSLVDLSDRGAQPMTRGPLTITYNGEIYNYRELRETLRGRGVDFESGTDTEVVLRAFETWGPECVERLCGMFAFVIRDARDGSLFVARDRLGIKPLYWYRDRDVFLFASEVQALVRFGLVPRRIDWGCAVRRTVGFLLAGDDGTLVEGVSSFPPGHWGRLTHGALEVQRYWSIQSVASRDELPVDVEAEIHQHLERSVREHLNADVPVACFLSGGLDSSVLTALAARHGGSTCITAITLRHEGGGTTLGGDQADLDEQHARLVVEHLGGRLEHVVVTAPSSVDLPGVEHLVDLADFSTSVRLLAQAANYRAVRDAGLKAVLHGDGADELFCGYFGDDGIWRFLEVIMDQEPSIQSWPWVNKILAPEVIAQAGQILGELRERLRACTGAPMTRAHQFIVQTWLRRLLTKEDWVSMRYGIECRVPFLDHRVVECAFALPMIANVADDQVKLLLRRVATPLLPRDIAWRKKSHFPHPNREATMAFLGATFREHYAEIAASEMVRGLFNIDAIQRPEALHPERLWSIIYAWLWSRALLSCGTASRA